MSSSPGAGGQHGKGGAEFGRLAAEGPAGPTRLAVVAVLVLYLLVPGVVGSHVSVSDGRGVLVRAVATRMPAEAPAGASSTSWFCAGPRAFSGTSPGSVTVVNRNSSPVSGHIWWTDGSGTHRSFTPLTVPSEQSRTAPSPLGGGQWQAEDVEMAAGSVSAWESSGGPGGASVGACLSYTSSHWYFAGGDADGSDHLFYLLYNPSVTDAVVDMSFVDPAGPVYDSAFQAMLVPAGGLKVVDVTSRFFAVGPVAASISCRVGRITAFQAEARPPSPATEASAAPAGGTGAVSVVAGAPSAGRSWFFPEGLSGGGTSEVLYFYDPTDRASTLKVKVGLDAGQASPFVESVPAGSALALSLSSEARIPPTIGESIEVLVTSGAPVVTFQSLGTPAPSASSTALPTIGHGGTASPWLVNLLGARAPKRHWVLGGAPLQSSPSPLILIQNPGDKTLSAVIRAVDSGQSMAEKVKVHAGGHAVVASKWPAGTALTIQASGGIVAEQQWLSVGKVPGWVAELGAVASSSG